MKTQRNKRPTMATRGQRRYKARDICRLFDISKATLFRWEKDGLITGVGRDWRNWRQYTQQNIEEIRVLIRGKMVKR